MSGRRTTTAVAAALACLGIATAGSAASQLALGPPESPPRFEDVTATAGIDFRHHHGGEGAKHLPETMGAGLAWLDYDRDGYLDLYFVDSGALPTAGDGVTEPWRGEPATRPAGANALYRGGRRGFTAATATTSGDRGYGMGASVDDYDGDGFPDIYITNFGRNTLLRNNGDGTFSDVTEATGVGDERWSMSSAWGDLDGDGLPELYVVNYLVYDFATVPSCGEPERGIVSYCHISLFEGHQDALFHNEGDGSLRDITTTAGTANAGDGKGLGVSIGHLDNDGRLDIYVANDTRPNFMYLNRGELIFEDAALISGVGYSAAGRPQAGMGTALGDLDGSGSSEIMVTNFAFEPVNLYRQTAPGFFLDDTFALGVGELTVPGLGFGLALEDLDGDGDLDLVIANGHILDNVDQVKDNSTYPQPNQLLINRLTELKAGHDPDWRPARDLFRDGTSTAGEAISRARVSRGLAVGDYDGDGRPDLAITASNGPAELLRNDTTGSAQRMVLRLVGRDSARRAVGARLLITPRGANTTWTREVRSASSYASQHARDIYVGLGEADAARVEIIWPSGRREVIERLEAGSLHLLIEGRGVVARQTLLAPFRPE